MKKITSIALLSVCFAFSSINANARDKNVAKPVDRPIETRMSAPERSERSSYNTPTFGFGLSSIEPITLGGSGSLTGIIGFSPLDQVQAWISLPSTSPFLFAVGGAYKRTLLGNSAAGLHAGGGLALGTNGSFAMGFNALAGVHFTVSQAIAFHLDGGAGLSITKTASTSVTVPTTAEILAGATSTTSSSSDFHANFGIGAFSTLLGASVVYMF